MMINCSALTVYMYKPVKCLFYEPQIWMKLKMKQCLHKCYYPTGWRNNQTTILKNNKNKGYITYGLKYVVTSVYMKQRKNKQEEMKENRKVNWQTM